MGDIHGEFALFGNAAAKDSLLPRYAFDRYLRGYGRPWSELAFGCCLVSESRTCDSREP